MTPLIRCLWSRYILAPVLWVGAEIEWKRHGFTERYFNLYVSYAMNAACRWRWTYGKKRKISNFHPLP